MRRSSPIGSRWLLLLLLCCGWSGAARAQFVVDGRASASEIGPGKYQLVASYTGPHSEPDRGLKNLYAARTATALHLMLVASPTLSTDYSSLVLYLNAPGRKGVPAGTRLAGTNAIESPLLHRPILDLETDYALRLTTSATGVNHDSVYYSYADYTTPPTAAGQQTDQFAGRTDNRGEVLTVSAGALTGTRFAYTNTAGIGANSNTGWELEIPLAAIGAQAGSPLDLLAAFTSSTGIFTTDLFPQIAGRQTPLGPDPNFAAIPGTQALRLLPISIDGRLDANELGAPGGTPGLYRLVGEYPTPHPAGFGDYGFTKLYMAHSDTKVYLFVVGTVENNGNTFQLYFDTPGLTGVPRGQALPGVTPATLSSFEKMRAALDLQTDLGLALQGAVFTNTNNPAYVLNTVRYAGSIREERLAGNASDGTARTYASANVPQFEGLVSAYRTSPTGLLSSNPGNFGWEIELDRNAFGVGSTVTNATLQAFLIQNNIDGSFLATDMIPALPGIGITNPGNPDNVNFAQLPGRQALTYAFNCPTPVSLSYGATAYCQSAGNPTPTVSGPAGGRFSAPPVSLSMPAPVSSTWPPLRPAPTPSAMTPTL